MTNQVLIKRYNDIEAERIKLKERWINLQENKGSKDEIKQIGQKLTELTFNQAHILIDLERKE